MEDLTPKFKTISFKQKVQYPDNPTENIGTLYGGWKQETEALTSNNDKLRLEATNERILIGDATASNSGIGIFQGLEEGVYKFRVGDPSGNEMLWNGVDTLSITGTITATTGTIGGWTISSDAIFHDGALDANSAGMATADYPFYAGAKYANRASAPFRVTPAGDLVASSATITGALTTAFGSTINGTYIDSLAVSKLAAGAITSKAITLELADGTGDVYIAGGNNMDFANWRGGDGTGGAIMLGLDDSDSNKGKFFAGNYSTGKYVQYDGDDLVVNGYVSEGRGTFGGNGSDGALEISSGTTTIDCANEAIVIKNYSSISITGTGKLAFSNPHDNGTIIILKSKGDVIITSSSSPAIDLTGMGAKGGDGGEATNPGRNGGDGEDPTNLLGFDTTDKFGGGGEYNYAAGSAGAAWLYTTEYSLSAGSLSFKTIRVVCGAGGGGGSTGYSVGGTPAAGGDGGRGGGALYIECKGSLNGTGEIDYSGSDGGDGDNAFGSDTAAGGGGGGGAEGMCLILYNSLTANTLTFTGVGGDGGDGGDGQAGGTGNNGGCGGGGAGAYGGIGAIGGRGRKFGVTNAENGASASTGTGAGGGGAGGGQGAASAGGTGGTGGTTASPKYIGQNNEFA